MLRFTNTGLLVLIDDSFCVQRRGLLNNPGIGGGVRISVDRGEPLRDQCAYAGNFLIGEIVDITTNFAPAGLVALGIFTIARPQPIADILKAQNKAVEEIRAIEEDLKALDQVDRFLAIC